MSTIYDLGFAAYLKIVKNIQFSKSPKKIKQNNKPRFYFYFDIKQSELSELKTEYSKSMYAAFDTEVKQLKRLLNS